MNGSTSSPTWATPTSGRPSPTGREPFTPLALAAAWEPRLRLGTAIMPAYTRAPACLAQERGVDGRRCTGSVRGRHRVVQQRDHRTLEWDPVRRAVQEGPRRRPVSQGCARRRRSTHSYDTFEVNGFKLGVRPEQTPRSWSLRCARACFALPVVRQTGRSSTGSRPRTCPRWRGSSSTERDKDDRRPDLRLSEREQRGGPRRHEVHNRRVSERARVRHVSRLAGPWRPTPRNVGCVEGGGSQGGTRHDPRSGRRRPGGARLTSRLSGADPGVLRQQCHHQFVAMLPLDPELDYWQAVTDLSPSAG